MRKEPKAKRAVQLVDNPPKWRHHDPRDIFLATESFEITRMKAKIEVKEAVECDLYFSPEIAYGPNAFVFVLARFADEPEMIPCKDIHSPPDGRLAKRMGRDFNEESGFVVSVPIKRDTRFIEDYLKDPVLVRAWGLVKERGLV